MAERIQTVEIEDYGPVEIKTLTKSQVTRIREESGGEIEDGGVLVFQRGVAEKRLREMDDEQFLAEFAERPQVLTRIINAILERSWPNQDEV